MAGNIHRMSQMPMPRGSQNPGPSGAGAGGGHGPGPVRLIHGMNFMISSPSLQPGQGSAAPSGHGPGPVPVGPGWNSELLYSTILTLQKLRDHERIPKKTTTGAGGRGQGQGQRRGHGQGHNCTPNSSGRSLQNASFRRGGSGAGGGALVSDYEFTKDIFTKNPTKDLIELTHLVFTLVFPEESKTKFRDTWPVYEKKQEGEYRKIAFIWCEEVVKEYPHFFEDVKPQFAWFVKPGGDKFIKFMLKFVTWALNTIAERIAKKKGKALLGPPKVENASKEIMWKQMQLYKMKSAQLTKDSLEKQKEIDQSNRELKTNSRDLETSFQTQEMEQMVEINQILNENPELFPSDAQDQLISDERLNALQTAIGNSGPVYQYEENQDQAKSSIGLGVDPLAHKLDEVWSNKMFELNEKLQIVGDMMDDKKELFNNMKVLVNNPIAEFDLPEMPQKQNESFQSYLHRAQANMNCLTQMFPNASITDIKSEKFRDKLFKEIGKAQRLLDSVLASTNGNQPAELSTLTEHQNHQISSLSLKCEDVDWSQLIPKQRSGSGSSSANVDESWSDTMDIKKAVVLTPAKEFDFNEKGGKFRQLIPSLPSPSTSCTKDDVRRLTNALQISESYSESPKLYVQLLKNKNVTAGAGREIQDQLQVQAEFDELSPIPMAELTESQAFTPPPQVGAEEEEELLGIMDMSMPSGFLDDLDL